jgi:hypothetical protein
MIGIADRVKVGDLTVRDSPLPVSSAVAPSIAGVNASPATLVARSIHGPDGESAPTTTNRRSARSRYRTKVICKALAALRPIAGAMLAPVAGVAGSPWKAYSRRLTTPLRFGSARSAATPVLLVVPK